MNQQQFDEDLYKTELCNNILELGFCKYHWVCVYAHHPGELRTRKRPLNYKTIKCINMENTGYCKYGKRCRFKHHEDDTNSSDDSSSQ